MILIKIICVGSMVGGLLGAPELKIIDLMDHSLWSSLGYLEKSILDTSRRNIHVDPLSAQSGLELWNPKYFPSADTIINRVSGRPFTISVEGNVGSGKSTLLQYFNDYPDISVYKEPVEMWTNLNGTDFLGLVYQDSKRWGMAFESLVQRSMLDHHIRDRRQKGKLTPPVKVMERSLQSCRYCFVEQLRTVLSIGEVNLLDSWHQLMKNHIEFDIDVDVIIYLKTSPEVAFQRVKKRNRQEEMSLPLDYFDQMHRLHESWLVYRNSTGSIDLPIVVVVDANSDLSTLSTTYRKLAKDIYQSIPKELRTEQYYNRN